uniref:Ankyrin repeat and protein kinase domain-containing protein 1-like n=1 Tax=Saccoglossus kowalevskii TaxID=10224 RepID=A0ABM0M4Y6_SACKO|nr:PREDICTED: ankyrin repeat and protein kinase domain-containing protein 1-like [Saccoglossus kowalevskii]
MAEGFSDIGHIIDYSDIKNEKKIGHGGFGIVYKAILKDQGAVAVRKVFKNLKIPIRNMLEDEVRKMVSFRSPYLVKLIGAVMDPSNHALVLEYMCHGSLRDYQKNNDVSWPIILRLVHDVILGMNYLHKTLKLVHQDLKIDNILVDIGPKAKISDFGSSVRRVYSMTVADHYEEKKEEEKEEDVVCNTISHMAPEFLQNKRREPNEKYDVYSFGITLWEIVTQKDPYENAVATEVIEWAVCQNQRPSEEDIPTECPAVLNEMMHKCWDMDPYIRPKFEEIKEMFDIVQIKDLRNNEIEEVTQLPANYRDVADRDKTMRSKTLMEAASKGDIEEVKELLRMNCDVTTKDKDGNTALHISILQRRNEVTELLINYGIDIDMKGQNEKTALHCAAQIGELDILQKLFDMSADLEVKDKLGSTPIHYACKYGGIGAVKKCLELGSDLQAKSTIGSSGLHLACAGIHNNVVDLLLEKGMEIESKDKYGFTPLHYASFYGNNDEIVKNLIRRDCNTKAKTKRGRTAFQIAKQKNHREIANLLTPKDNSENSVQEKGTLGGSDPTRAVTKLTLNSTFTRVLNSHPQKRSTIPHTTTQIIMGVQATDEERLHKRLIADL